MQAMHSSVWRTVGQNQVVLRHLIIHFPMSSGMSEWGSKRTSQRSGAREQSKQCGTSEWVSGASNQANGRASGPLLTSWFSALMHHCSAFRLYICIKASAQWTKFVPVRLVVHQLSHNFMTGFSACFPPLFLLSFQFTVSAASVLCDNNLNAFVPNYVWYLLSYILYLLSYVWLSFSALVARRVFDDITFGGAQIDMGPTEYWARQNISLFWSFFKVFFPKSHDKMYKCWNQTTKEPLWREKMSFFLNSSSYFSSFR